MGEKQGHTPGPWTYGVPSPGANFSIYATRMSIGRLGIASNSKRAAEGEANARLIAAAPDLLEALRQVMGWIDGWDPNFIHDADWPETAHHIRAAISRATGEDSPANEGLA